MLNLETLFGEGYLLIVAGKLRPMRPQLQQAAPASVFSVGTQHALCSSSAACLASGMQHALFSPLRFASSP